MIIYFAVVGSLAGLCGLISLAMVIVIVKQRRKVNPIKKHS